MSDEAKKFPSIKLRVTDYEQFNVEVDFETPSLEFARLMLDTASKTIERLQRDQEAAEFGAKMERAAQAHRAMQKLPRLA